MSAMGRASKKFWPSGSINLEVKNFCEIQRLIDLSQSLEWMSSTPDGGPGGGAPGRCRVLAISREQNQHSKALLLSVLVCFCCCHSSNFFCPPSFFSGSGASGISKPWRWGKYFHEVKDEMFHLMFSGTFCLSPNESICSIARMTKQMPNNWDK